jgi:hypothetical protein
MRDVVLRHPQRAAQDERLEHGGVEAAVGRGHAGELAVGDRLVLQRHSKRPLEEGVHVAEGDASVIGGGLELGRVGQLLDLEVGAEHVADGDLLVPVVLQPGQQAVCGEHEQARV